MLLNIYLAGDEYQAASLPEHHVGGAGDEVIGDAVSYPPDHIHEGGTDDHGVRSFSLEDI